MSGTLFLVPNTLDFGVANGDPPPLSDDLPLGVVRTAARLGHWVAENAKTTRAFLKRVDAVVPLIQALQAIEIVELPRPPKGSKLPPASTSLDGLLAPALAGHDMGLISEAGLPAVADPGALLVEAAHRLSIKVVPLAGASSLLLALAASGLNGQSFAFVGYLPVDASERATRIRELEGLSRRTGQTQMLIETPYRNETMLEALLAALAPGTRLSVSCGLSLPSGWTRTDTVARWKAVKTAVPKDIPAVFSLLA
jgi:16S rRNA (cytidine1402-2'-O)-methyltransferase